MLKLSGTPTLKKMLYVNPTHKGIIKTQPPSVMLNITLCTPKMPSYNAVWAASLSIFLLL
jgi:hypothetical protein